MLRRARRAVLIAAPILLILGAVLARAAETEGTRDERLAQWLDYATESVADAGPEELRRLEDEFRSAMTPQLGRAFAGQRVREEYHQGAHTLAYTVKCPDELTPGRLYPAVIRIGYPPGERVTAAHQWANLQALYGDVPDGEPVFMFRAGINDDLSAGSEVYRSTEAGSYDVFEIGAIRWRIFLDRILERYPLDPSRLYVTGQSYEGVQALSLGLSAPDRIAGIAAFSAVSYPFSIYYRYEHGLNCKVLVHRGALDHQFEETGSGPRGQSYKAKELEFGRRLRGIGRQNVFLMREGYGHQDVYRHCREAIGEVLAYTRPTYPRRIARRFLLSTETQTEWITVAKFPDGAFLPAFVDWEHRHGVSYDRMHTIEQCPSLFAQIRGNHVDVRATLIDAFDLHLSPWLIQDVTAPVTVSVNGIPAWQGSFEPSARTLADDYRTRRDLRRLFWQRVRIDVPPTVRPGMLVEHRIDVPATTEWVDTGICLREGLMVSVSASGWVQGNTNGRDWAHGPWNPDGRDDRGRLPRRPTGGDLLFYLQGRVNGTVFPIGTRSQGRAKHTGLLQLGVRDIYHGDNSGRFTARITVSR